MQLVLALSALNAAMPASSSSFVDLKRRVDRLGDTPSFQVVDHGRVVFSVRPSHVQLNGPNERPAVELNASVNGGLVTTESIDGTAQISVGITTNHAGVVMYKDGVARVDLGRRPWGGYALRFLSASEELVAGIGDSVDRSGALSLADAEGRLRSTVTAKTVGSFNVNSHAGAAIVSFRRSQIGAGLLSIGNADRREAIKMAVNGNRYGAVIAGPRVGFPLMRGSGLPGSYILGCAAGPACVPR